MAETQWLTTAQVAAMLGVSEQRARQLAKRLGAIRTSDRLLIWPRDAVEREVQRRRTGAPRIEPEQTRKVRAADESLHEIADTLKGILTTLEALRRAVERGKDAEDDGDGQGR
ncbi:hypothetical protein TH66_05055 [Carbonactinospora thermoautotrophica]|uniref:Helix-turn-helix domain-containing protein n=1 Tax=Carbonactinospora thermoautotrophica TaxID=1469144 RepID=A0A132NHY6_9ACTN|nr:helix-turn-helix domain-containing protein [Carbonactinospora thermoautotrophica]KWX05098.1 hypothetical protein TH66_05055 [Carbonactinospora thermoautotrophica]KWX09745.1 hypothetical protein TR74_07765 [Carbonactinospora thermoautotrophica]